jgi:hypothetical protein
MRLLMIAAVSALIAAASALALSPGAFAEKTPHDPLPRNQPCPRKTKLYASIRNGLRKPEYHTGHARAA